MCVCIYIITFQCQALFSTSWSCHIYFYYLCCFNLPKICNSLIDDSIGKGCVDVSLLDEIGIDFTDPIQVDILYIEVCQCHVKVDNFYRNKKNNFLIQFLI